MSAFDVDMRGDKDLGLSALGIRQARNLAEALSSAAVGRVVSSDMKRARETGGILADRLAVPFQHHWSELNEIAPGGLSSGRRRPYKKLASYPLPRPIRRSVDALLYKYLSVYYLWQWRRGRTHEADSPAVIRERVHVVLSRLAELEEERVAVVGHGFWILFLCLEVLEVSVAKAVANIRWVDNCSVTSVVVEASDRHRLGYFARRLSL